MCLAVVVLVHWRGVIRTCLALGVIGAALLLLGGGRLARADSVPNAVDPAESDPPTPFPFGVSGQIFCPGMTWGGGGTISDTGGVFGEAVLATFTGHCGLSGGGGAPPAASPKPASGRSISSV